eukprot:TRINITY_DN67939_c0_g1_i1.p1 TRINITY_DN67939_c0_g1~~TRINITY_DN67939_c0_g1_i1.p1  ORF type:complete len:111 (-),score=25.53 TRINITY_DN67939_c0_g1_i1:90-401(-)
MGDPIIFSKLLKARGGQVVQWAVAQARPVLEKRLPRGVQWEEIKQDIYKLPSEKILSAIDDPESFLKALQDQGGPAALPLAMDGHGAAGSGEKEVTHRKQPVV